MTRILLLCAFIHAAAFSTLAAEADPLFTVQRLFDVMSKHDGQTGRTLFTADATLTTVHGDGQATVMPAADWLQRISSGKNDLLERIWSPQVLQQGPIAVVWAPYDFHLNGKFHHCGTDAFNLIKTEAGWRIASVSYTSESTGCAPSPLGPPPVR